MFGTDTTPNAESYRVYWQFLETADEYFDCSKSHHYQGRWKVYGMYLARRGAGKDLLQERGQIDSGAPGSEIGASTVASDLAV